MKKFLILMVSLAIFSSCSDDDDAAGSLRIRLANSSEFNFENITVNTSTGTVSFENLAAGETSAYQNFGLAYRYAFVELEIEGKIYTIQPVDYVGETPLENGDYTYQIDANDSTEQFGKFSLSLIEE